MAEIVDATDYFSLATIVDSLFSLLPELPEELVANFDRISEHPSVGTPRVQTETPMIKWYKQLSLYLIWGWVVFSCSHFAYL